MLGKSKKLPDGMLEVWHRGVAVVVPANFHNVVEDAMRDCYQQGKQDALAKMTIHLGSIINDDD